MNKLDKKIQYIETILFFVIWIIILLLGADFPPPIGFLWAILVTIILDLIQFFYLEFLLPRILKERTFLKNSIFFFTGGILLSLAINIGNKNFYMNNTNLKSKIIWISVITCVSSIYGMVFWVFNKNIKNHFNLNKKM